MAFKGFPCLTLCDEIHAWFNRNAKASSRRIFLFHCWKSEFKATKNISSKPFSFPQEKSIKIDTICLKLIKKHEFKPQTSTLLPCTSKHSHSSPFFLCHQMKLKNHCELKSGSSPCGLSGVKHAMYLKINKHAYRAIPPKSRDFYITWGSQQDLLFLIILSSAI